MKLACLIRPTDSVILQQHLFTVYVHPSKSFEGGSAADASACPSSCTPSPVMEILTKTLYHRTASRVGLVSSCMMNTRADVRSTYPHSSI